MLNCQCKALSLLETGFSSCPYAIVASYYLISNLLDLKNNQTNPRKPANEIALPRN